MQEKLSENPEFIKTFRGNGHAEFDPMIGFFRLYSHQESPGYGGDVELVPQCTPGETPFVRSYSTTSEGDSSIQVDTHEHDWELHNSIAVE